MASRKKGASVSQGQALRVASRDRDRGKGSRQPSAALPETKMTSARKNVAKVTKSGVREKSARGTSRAKATKTPIQATPPRALRSRRAVTLQQSSADTESKEDAPDVLTEDSFVEVQEPHKRQHQRTRSPDVQLEHRGEPAYIPTENERRWEPGQDRQQGNAVASGSSALTSTAAEVHSSEDRYRPSSPRAQSSQPKGFSRPEVVPSEGDTSRSRSRIQGGHPRSGDEEGWKQPKAIDGLRPEFVSSNPGGNSRGRDYANQASDQSHRLPVEENYISGPRRRSSSLDGTFRTRNDARASEIRRWIGPSPYMDPCVRMPDFDGSGDLELFLHRFHVLSEFYCWDRREQLFRLQQCVRGDAQYMCMDLTSAEDVDDFKRVLRERFGTAGHAERYRAELSQLRRGEMTLEKLHLQVRALVSKVAPGTWTSLTEIYARDAFLNALDDDDLRRRVLMTCPPPTTLAMAYDLALRSAALEPRVRCDHYSEDSWRSRSPAKRQQRRTRALITEKDDESPQNIQELTVANSRLQKQVEELQQRLQKFPAGKSCTETASVRPTVEPQSGKANIIYFRCHKTGHMAKHCREKLLRNAGLRSESQTNVISRMSAPGTKVYIQVGYGGKQYRVLLDTGCEISMLSTKVIPNLPYQKFEHKLLAANMSAVPILGKATIAFRLGPIVIESDFLVSEAIEELIFGADWLEQNKCIWDFATETLIVRSTGSPLRVPLYGGCRNACVRRLYAGESVNLEPHSQRDLAVKTVWSTRPPSHADWLVEPVTLKPGVMLARTLLAESPEEAYVRVTNCNATAFCLEAGELLAIAEAVPPGGCLDLDEHYPKMQDTEQRLDIDEAETSDIDTEHGPQLPEHLKGLLESLPSTLTAEQHRRASKFLCCHANVFSTSNTDLGKNSMLPHRIDTGESCPAHERNSVPVVLTTVPHTCTSSKPQHQSSSAPGLKWANERPKREHKLPIRFRRTKLDCNLMEMDIDKVGKRKRRSDEQKKRRREFERGPWPCSYCDCAPYTSSAGYRDHMILVHKKSCSWTGVVGDFADDETAANVGDHIRSQRAKKRRRTIGPTTSVEPQRLASLELADQELTSASAAQPDSGPSSMASESQPAGLNADLETSIIRLLVGSPSTTGVVGNMASYSDATWTPDPVMWEEWNTLLGPDTGAVISDAQPASTSDIVNGGVNIDQGQVSLHDESTMIDVIKCDVAVQVVPSCDASVQAVTTCYNSATQTLRGEARYLPNGVSLGRVLEEIQENPDLSLGQIRGRLLTESQLQPSDDTIDLLNFVLFAMMQTRKDLISAVCNAQIEAGRLRERDPQAARVRLDTTMAMVRCEMNRDLDVVSHTAAANVAVEEIERPSRSQSYGDSDCEVVSDDE
jgi:hypothetical protein